MTTIGIIGESEIRNHIIFNEPSEDALNIAQQWLADGVFDIYGADDVVAIPENPPFAASIGNYYINKGFVAAEYFAKIDNDVVVETYKRPKGIKKNMSAEWTESDSWVSVGDKYNDNVFIKQETNSDEIIANLEKALELLKSKT